MVAEGKFREDLFYRLDVVTVNLPPLRNRPGDIPLLVAHFIRAFAEENARKIEGLTPDAMDALGAYRWPGNVRELRNVIERMVVLSRSDRLTLRDVPATIRESVPGLPAVTPATRGGPLSLEQTEKQMIIRALRAHDGNVTHAAADLGISRRTLHRKINEYSLRDSATPPPA